MSAILRTEERAGLHVRPALSPLGIWGPHGCNQCM